MRQFVGLPVVGMVRRTVQYDNTYSHMGSTEEEDCLAWYPMMGV